MNSIARMVLATTVILAGAAYLSTPKEALAQGPPLCMDTGCTSPTSCGFSWGTYCTQGGSSCTWSSC